MNTAVVLATRVIRIIIDIITDRRLTIVLAYIVHTTLNIYIILYGGTGGGTSNTRDAHAQTTFDNLKTH